MSETETAIVVCRECGTPVRVDFMNGEIVKVLATCGHVQVMEDRPGEDS